MSNFKRMVVKDNRRMFDAGNQNRLTMSWSTNDFTADQVIFSQLDTLRARAREQSRNNDYVARLIQVLQNNIVGSNGFKARSQIVDFQGKPDLVARKAIEFAWSEYVESLDLVSLFILMIANLVTDGEVFVYLRETAQGIKPDLIDPARIDTQFNRSTDEGPLVIMGIEYNEFLEPIAYHVNDSYEKGHPGTGAQGSALTPRTRVPAANMIHLFKKLYVGQKRGLPWVAASLARLFQLGRYEEAALTAARIGAAKMGFFRSDDDEEYTGDGESGEMQLNAEAGTFENIGAMNFEAFDPTYPAGEFKTFMDKTLQGIASGLGIDYHTLGNDLSGVNYSSARVGMLETREYYKTVQGWMITNLIKPLFKRWLQTELFYQRITIKQRPLSRGLFYYLPISFVGRRWEWVDPQKEAMGKKIQWEMRTLSLSQIIRERGDDPDEVFQEIAEETKRLKDLGITPEQVMKKVEAKQNAEQEDDRE